MKKRRRDSKHTKTQKQTRYSVKCERDNTMASSTTHSSSLRCGFAQSSQTTTILKHHYYENAATAAAAAAAADDGDDDVFSCNSGATTVEISNVSEEKRLEVSLQNKSSTII
jgi:acetylornithine/succinyldiaminopimelate/putrescine aminotransferase